MSKTAKRAIRIIIIALLFILGAASLSFLTSPFERLYAAQSVSESKKQIALSFDDGPGEYTEELLAGLRERGVKASFFVQGRKIEGRESLIETMHQDGHLIGCHTWSHINFLKSSAVEIREQLDRTNELIESITGERPLFYRPPYGYYLGSQLNRIESIAILWSASPRDWVHEDEAYICEYLVEKLRDGDIVLLHDTKPTTVPAVLRAIDILSAEGYEFVRADELLCRNGERLAAGLAYRFCAYNGRAWYI